MSKSMRNILMTFGFVLLMSNTALALDSDKDLTLDDNSGDSPSVVVRDGSDQEFRMQKKSGGGGELRATSGPISLKPSGDTSKSFSFETLSSNLTQWFSNALSNKPGIRLNDSTNQLEYREMDLSNWSRIDGKWSVSTKFADFSITAADDRTFFVVENLTTATLPEAAAVGADFMVSISRTGEQEVMIFPNGSETIAGHDRVRLKEKNSKLTLITDGTSWYRFESEGFVYFYDLSGSCPAGYVSVPANALYGITEDFCVAKYEMKSNLGAAVSEPSGNPWVSIDQDAARTACEALGTEYHLVTNE